MLSNDVQNTLVYIRLVFISTIAEPKLFLIREYDLQM